MQIENILNVLIVMATSGLRIEEFNPRSQSRPRGRFWFVGRDPGLQHSAIRIQSVEIHRESQASNNKRGAATSCVTNSACFGDEYNEQPFVVAKSIEDFSWLTVQILFLPPDEVFWQQPVAFLLAP
jgi:hypothetical protein